MKKRSGFTLTELFLTLIGFSILFVLTISTFLVASKALLKYQERIPVGEELSQGLQKVARELREATETMGRANSSGGSGSISHTIRYRDAEDSQYYVLYLYSPNDPNFNSSYVSSAVYDLRLVAATGFSYGSGTILARYLLSPNAPNSTDRADLRVIGSSGSRRLQLTLTAAQILEPVSEKTEKVKIRLLIRPRNQ